MADIFISYKREDKQTIESLAKRLELAGWSVWWDNDILGGDDYDITIQKELEISACVIVLWSSFSVNSRNVKDEANAALALNKLVPLSIDNVKLPFGFGMIQAIPIQSKSNISDDEFEKIKASIIKKTGLVQTPSKPRPPKGFFEKNWYYLLGLTLIIVSLIIFRPFGKYNGSAEGPVKDDSTKNGNSEIKTEIKTYYRDIDKDGFGDPGFPLESLNHPPGYVNNHDDCCDNEPLLFNNATAKKYFIDNDGDGYGSSVKIVIANVKPSFNVVENGTDFDDLDEKVYPGQTGWFTTRSKGGTFDYNCDGRVTLENTSIGRKPATIREAAQFVKRPGFNCPYFTGWIGFVPDAGVNSDFGIGCNDDIVQIQKKTQAAH
jgi:hypothetical protein